MTILLIMSYRLGWPNDAKQAQRVGQPVCQRVSRRTGREVNEATEFIGLVRGNVSLNMGKSSTSTHRGDRTSDEEVLSGSAMSELSAFLTGRTPGGPTSPVGVSAVGHLTNEVILTASRATDRQTN